MSSRVAVEGKRVTWAEAFFDLVVVLAVTQVATLLGVRHQWWELPRAFAILALVYRTWVLTSLQSNRLGRDSTRDRVTLFGVGLCGLVMAIAIPLAYDSGGMQFALAFWGARILIWLRYVSQYQARAFSSLGLSALLVGPMIAVGATLPESSRELLWCVAALIDLGMVAFFGRRHELIHYDHYHLMERYGLFVLIALGESIIDLSLPLARQPTAIRPGELAAVGVCFIVILPAVVDVFRPRQRRHRCGDEERSSGRGHVTTSGLRTLRNHRRDRRHRRRVRANGEPARYDDDPHPPQPPLRRHDPHACVDDLSPVGAGETGAGSARRCGRGAPGLALRLAAHPGIVATGVLASVLLVLVVVEKRWPTFASWGGTQLADIDD